MLENFIIYDILNLNKHFIITNFDIFIVNFKILILYDL